MSKKIVFLSLIFFFVWGITSYAIENAAGTNNGGSVDDMLSAVHNRMLVLDKREDDIRKEEERLKTLKMDIKKTINTLTQERKHLEKVLSDLRTEKKEGLQKLAKLYENMPSEEAALRIEKLNKDMAVMLLSAMKPRTAGKILGFVRPSKAAELTQAIGKKLREKKKSHR